MKRLIQVTWFAIILASLNCCSVVAADFFPIAHSGRCEYSGQSFAVFDSIPNSDTSFYYPVERYEFGNRTPSPYDTDKIKRAVLKFLHPWLDSNDSMAVEDLEFYLSTILLRATWEFPNDSENVLLRFDSQVWPLGTAYFAFNRKNARLQPLVDGAADVTPQFNNLVETSPRAFGLDPLCQTLLLLKLRYLKTPVFVIRNADEVVTASFGYDELSDRDDKNRDWLFCEDIQQEPLLLAACRTARRSDYDRDREKEIKRTLATIADRISPPVTERRGDTTLTRLTIYDKFAGEVAWIESVILSTGRVLNLRYLNEPTQSYFLEMAYGSEGAVEGSPYHRHYSKLAKEIEQRPDARIQLRGCGNDLRLTWRFDHADVSVDLRAFLDTLESVLTDPPNGKFDSTCLFPILTLLSDSIALGRDVSLDYEHLVYPLMLCVEDVVRSFVESGRVTVIDRATGESVSWIRQYDFEGSGICHYWARRFCLPSNTAILDITTGVS